MRCAFPIPPIPRGIVFDGRIAEDFKLTTGTWVHVGALRVGVLAAAAPRCRTRSWPARTGIHRTARLAQRRRVPDADRRRRTDFGRATSCGHPAVREHVRPRSRAGTRRTAAPPSTIARVLLLAEPPSIDANEITDKGYINQRLALERRRAEVEQLFASPPDPAAIMV